MDTGASALRAFSISGLKAPSPGSGLKAPSPGPFSPAQPTCPPGSKAPLVLADDALPAVGVRRLRDADDAAEVPVYRGVSYCDAVRLAGEGGGPNGGAWRVLPGSIQVCRWAPVVLGLKPPEDAFEQGLAPRLPCRPAGLLLAPLATFPGQPEVVILRATPAALRARLAVAEPSALWRGHGGQLARSALPILTGGGGAGRRGLIATVNRLLAALAPWDPWQRLTQRLFRYRAVTIGFDALISRALADMSICRNSTAIPLLTGQANVSFFCTGGITWGRNPPTHLTSGWPFPIYQSTTPQSPIYQSTNLPTHHPDQSGP